MDILQGYGDESPIANSSEKVDAEPPCSDRKQEISHQEDDICSVECVEQFVASLPPCFRCEESSLNSQGGEACGAQRHDVDPKVAMTVEKWIEMKNKGYTITQDLRRRNWYKSPDMMMSMLEKFDIHDCGSCLQDLNGERPTRSDLRRLWVQYEERRKIEKEKKRSGRNIEFTRGDAVSAAVAAAQAHAASFRR